MCDITTDKSKTEDLFGCAFDLGGSQCKVTYAKHSTDCTNKVTICCANFKVDQIEKAIELIREDGRVDGQGGVLHATGVSAKGSKKTALEAAFRAEVRSLSEFDCQTRALEFLVRSYPQSSIVIGPPTAAIDYVTAHIESYERLKNIKKTSFPLQSNALRESSECFADSDSDLYPYLLVNLGSGCSYAMVAADGQTTLLTGRSVAGKTFCGLGHHLVNTRSYDELIALAEQGEGSLVTTHMRELKSPSDADHYQAIPDDMAIFDFGKAADGYTDGAHPSRADLAAALLAMMCTELGQFTYWVAKAERCRRVFVTGGFVRHQRVQELVSASFMDEALKLYPDMATEIYFLQHGEYLASLGALLTHPTQH